MESSEATARFGWSDRGFANNGGLLLPVGADFIKRRGIDPEARAMRGHSSAFVEPSMKCPAAHGSAGTAAARSRFPRFARFLSRNADRTWSQ